MKNSKSCPHCGKSTVLKEYDPDEYRRRKIENARNSIKKAKANGTKMGPYRKRNDEKIISAYLKGYSFREIAKITKHSLGQVCLSLREHKGLK